MEIIKCYVCGGELEVNEDMSIGRCKYCDSLIAIPKRIGSKGALYNRAVFLRQKNEFDEAISAYGDLLKEDNTDAEAHWGMALSKFGIEYVKDPHTGTRLPTCHRTRIEPIISDADYCAAIEYADIEARRIYEQEGERIYQIQKKFLELSRNEEPYDVFICYKESDESGNRTEESIIAQDIYYELVKREYRVFFARKTLEDKLGQEYEPIIFAALNSAKVMVVVGTKKENFNAVWVHNEWSRFFDMMKTSKKMIIPAYKGMSPYDLPPELAVLQSLDISKIGFMQDLLDGISKLTREERNEKKERVTTADSVSVAPGILPFEKLIQNGDTYVSLGDYKLAKENYQQAIDYYPEQYKGWWGVIKCCAYELTDKTVSGEVWDKIKHYWINIKKLTSKSGELEKLQEEMKFYLKKNAELKYESDICYVKQQIEKYRRIQKEYEKKMQELEDDKKNLEQTKNNKIKEQENSIIKLNNDIKEMEDKLENSKTRMGSGCLITIIGIVLFLLFVYLWEKGSLPFDTPWVGIIVAVIGIWMFMKKDGTDAYPKQIENNNKNIILVKEELSEFKKLNEKEMRNINANIEKNICEINKLSKDIARAESYLETDSKMIINYYLSELYDEFQFSEKIIFDENIISNYKDYILKNAPEYSIV